MKATLTLFLLLLASSLFAQRGGWTIVPTENDVYRDAYLDTLRGDSLYYSLGRVHRSIAVDDIRRMQRTRSHQGKLGSIVGAVAGAGVVTYLTFNERNGPQHGGPSAVQVYPITLVVGAGIGYLGGGMIGSLVRTYDSYDLETMLPAERRLLLERLIVSP